ncbi:MAG TPA: glutathione S-transferase family protein [Amphiplicatus sp.]|nr:glutathione S-transferase family protein [Amphiplicatus sp.]HOP18624.1 glutathione S-transferase family protein [Amphiplicatus sp.]HRX38590.1 glutathione S-transferase family protein [Parvularculaceae bacterium]
MYRLYYSPGTATFPVHWMLLELGAPHELVTTDITKGAQKSAEYLKLNPTGRVPTLVVDGKPYGEVASLLMLLAERHPQAGLGPAPGEAGRADYLQWMFYLANTVQPPFRLWFYPHEAAGEANAEAAKAEARAQIEKAWDRVDAQIASGGPYLLGTHLSAADFLVTMLMRWSRNMPKPASDWPHIAAYLKMIKAMPSLREQHKREGLTDWIDA